MTRDDMTRWLRDHRTETMTYGVSLLLLVASLWVGTQSRTHSVSLDKQLTDLRATSTKLASWMSSYRSVDAKESAALTADSAAVQLIAIPAGRRVWLMQSVAGLAQQANLSNVRLSFAPPPDSTYVPPRGGIGVVAIHVGSDVVDVDCTGSFEAVLRFVSILPPSLTVTHVAILHGPSETTYRVVLSAYEVTE